jgi:hypothetical protein
LSPRRLGTKILGITVATTKNQQNERRGGIRGRTGGPGKDKRTRAPIPISSSSCRHHSFFHKPTSSSLEIWEGQQQASSSNRGDLQGEEVGTNGCVWQQRIWRTGEGWRQEVQGEGGSGGTGMLDNGAGRTTGTGRSRNMPGRCWSMCLGP